MKSLIMNFAKCMGQFDLDLGEMNVKLVDKVEELTLYILQLEERLSKLERSEK